MTQKRETTGRKVAKKRNNPDEHVSSKHSERFRIELTKQQKEIVNFIIQNKIKFFTKNLHN